MGAALSSTGLCNVYGFFVEHLGETIVNKFLECGFESSIFMFKKYKSTKLLAKDRIGARLNNINMKKSDFLPNTPLCCNKSNWFHRFCPILGGLFSPLPNDNDHQTTDPQEIAFRYAVDKINADNKILPRSKLHAEIERIMPQDSFHASKRVCHLMKTGVAAIFGPQSSHTASHVQSICDTMEVSCNLIHLNIHFLFPKHYRKVWSAKNV